MLVLLGAGFERDGFINHNEAERCLVDSQISPRVMSSFLRIWVPLASYCLVNGDELLEDVLLGRAVLTHGVAEDVGIRIRQVLYQRVPRAEDAIHLVCVNHECSGKAHGMEYNAEPQAVLPEAVDFDLGRLLRVRHAKLHFAHLLALRVGTDCQDAIQVLYLRDVVQHGRVFLELTMEPAQQRREPRPGRGNGERVVVPPLLIERELDFVRQWVLKCFLWHAVCCSLKGSGYYSLGFAPGHLEIGCNRSVILVSGLREKD